ncbi:MAG: 30S ribosomal protein S6 [Clostridia bacterium]|nr:30S ribosomal protein S6 [Clostridia bacterium]
MSNSYETTIIYSLANGEEAAKALSAKFQEMMEKNGTVDSVDEWGKRRLAYLINDEEDGYYVLYNHTCEAGFPAELERVLGITDGVLRSMVIKK